MAEALVFLFIVGMFMPMCAEMADGAAAIYRAKTDREIAAGRAENVISLLKSPAYYCGVGLAAEPADYKKAFNNRQETPFSWAGPLSVIDHRDGRKDSVIRLTYAIPDDAFIVRSEHTGDFKANAYFDKAPVKEYLATDYYNPSRYIKNWVIVAGPQARTPFYAHGQDGKMLKLKNYIHKEPAFAKRSRLHYVRALETYAESGVLRSNDFRTAGIQPRENGIADARFKIKGRKLKVYLLVEGADPSLAQRRGKSAALLKDWPAEYPEKLNGSKFQLYAFAYTLPLKNYDAPDAEQSGEEKTGIEPKQKSK